MFQSVPMTYEQVCEYFGSAAAAGRKLGKSRQAVNLWKKHGIPHSAQLHIQEKTRGKLKAAEK